MNNKRNVLLSIVIAVIVITGIVYYQYNRVAFAIADVTGESISAGALLGAYVANEVQANNKYLNKVLQVTGSVTQIKHGIDNSFQILLDANDPMSAVACTIEKLQQEVKVGQRISLKGICTGYLNDVILIKCVLVPLRN